MSGEEFTVEMPETDYAVEEEGADEGIVLGEGMGDDEEVEEEAGEEAEEGVEGEEEKEEKPELEEEAYMTKAYYMPGYVEPEEQREYPPHIRAFKDYINTIGDFQKHGYEK